MRCVFLCKTQQIKSKIKTVIKTFALNHPEILLDLKSTLRFNVSKTDGWALCGYYVIYS
jgi:hypothetical protein